MYIAMNRFKIERGKEGVFEDLWLSRDSHLKNVSGFLSFNLLKGATEESFTLYASHSMWNSQKDFSNWTRSEAFRAAHKNAGGHSEIYIGHPVFEGFEIIM
jgi:heme-degrading monooxygenase HmoA